MADETTNRYCGNAHVRHRLHAAQVIVWSAGADEKLALARQNFACFRNRLDLAIFKNAAVRYGRELIYVASD